jgi:hypothetical protein
MGFSIHSEDYLFDGYMSYNFSDDKFTKYWYIKKHMMGHTALTVLKYLNIALEKMKNDGFKPYYPAGMDGWTPNENVFMNNLTYIKERVEELIENNNSHKKSRYYVDSASGGSNIPDYTDVESENEEESFIDEKYL